MNKDTEKVHLDFEKFSQAAKAQKISLRELSTNMGYRPTYFSELKKRDGAITVNVERFICMELGLEPGSLIRREAKLAAGDENQSDKAAELLERIYKEQQKLAETIKFIADRVEMITDQNEAIWNKLNTQATQLIKIKEKLNELGATGYQKAAMFLKETLSNGQMLETEVVAKGEEAGISKADIYKAKRDLPVQVAVTGYGKNQKTWWLLSK